MKRSTLLRHLRQQVYASKPLEAYAVEEADAWLVITVVVKCFGENGA